MKLPYYSYSTCVNKSTGFVKIKRFHRDVHSKGWAALVVYNTIKNLECNIIFTGFYTIYDDSKVQRELEATFHNRLR